MKLEVRKLAKSYASGSGRAVVEALAPTSFDVHDGELVALVGPPGCGKSTVLNLLAGLEAPSGGEILLDGARVMGPGRERGMVFQSFTLFPWLTVEENARFSFRLSDPRDERDLPRALALLDLFGLGGHHRAYPRELSEAMKQRVAIARALATRPKLLLMDDPFGALEPGARAEMQHLLAQLEARDATAVLLVTTDLDEALFLADRVLVFSPRPGTIVRELAVPFGPGNTRVPALRETAEFVRLEREIARLLRQGHPAAEREAPWYPASPASN